MPRILMFAACQFLAVAAFAADLSPETLDTVGSDIASTSGVGNFTSALAVAAESDKTSATLKLNKQWVKQGTTGYSLALSAKTPFDSETDRVKDVGVLSELTAGTSVKLQGGILIWPSSGPTDPVDVICSAAVAKIFPGYYYKGGEQTDNIKNFASAENDTDCPSLLDVEVFKAVVDRINTRAKEQHEEAERLKQPGDAAIGKPVELKLPSGYDAILTLAAAEANLAVDKIVTTVHQVTLGATANRQKFSYASEGAPSKVDEDFKMGAGVELAYTMIMNTAVLGAGLSYERSYKGGEETEICTPIGMTTSLQCAEAALVAPAEKKKRLGFIEYRRILKKPFKLGISPRLEMDLKNSDVAVRLPLYLAFDQKRAFDGGVALGWSDAEDFSASIFIGKSFKLLGE